jgi:ubiquinone/menaquinone biosynthesis C-methylase UbiE
MPETAIAELNLRSWDTISASYQAGARIATDGVHYGPLAPSEQELCLLGDVRGKQVIEIGCGGSLNAIAFARWGTTCVGIDPSPLQLAHGRRLGSQHGVGIQFATGMAEDLGEFSDSTFDIALLSYAFDYVTNLRQAFVEAWRVLKVVYSLPEKERLRGLDAQLE